MIILSGLVINSIFKGSAYMIVSVRADSVILIDLDYPLDTYTK